MSRRGLIPLALALGFGIANGYITFNPALAELHVEKIRQKEALEAADLGPNVIEVPIGGKSRAEAKLMNDIPVDSDNGLRAEQTKSLGFADEFRAKWDHASAGAGSETATLVCLRKLVATKTQLCVA